MDGKDSSSLGYIEQESDPNRSLDDLPLGACAGDSTNEQMEMYKAKAQRRHADHIASKAGNNLREKEMEDMSKGVNTERAMENTDDKNVQASDGQQLVFGVQTQTVYVTSTETANLNERMRNMSVEEKTNSSRKSASERACKKKLSDMGFISRDKLAQLLDPNGIDDLMPLFLDNDDCRDVWRACHGGVDPAMGLIYTLATSQLTTLKEFIEYAIEATPERSNMLLLIINDYTKNMKEDGKDTVMKTRLDNLEYELINKIAKEISVRRDPVPQQQAPLWIFIADKAGIDMGSINYLNMPAIRASQCEGMTMKCLEVVNQRYPLKTVAWLANGLLDKGRNDVFVELASCKDFCFDMDGKHICE